MEKFANFVIRNKRTFLIVFVILLTVCAALIYFAYNKVDYDITSYLPEGYNTSDGYEILNKYFNVHGDLEFGITATGEQATALVERIRSMDGVAFLIWYGDLAAVNDFDIMTEAEFDEFGKVFKTPQNADEDTYNYAMLISLTDSPSSLEALKSLTGIKKAAIDAVGENNCSFAGMTELAARLYSSIFSEALLYIAATGVIVILLLLIFTSSFVEPVIILITIIVSVIINLGTHIIFPSISIVAFAGSAVLQIALSLDYSISLLHFYKEKLRFAGDPKKALTLALPEAAKAIIPAALIIFGGSLALLAMKFTIGIDLGLTLAKGAIMSLISTLLLQPSIILLLEKPRLKSLHAAPDIRIRPVVKRAVKWRYVIATAVVLAVTPLFVFQPSSLTYSYMKLVPASGDESIRQQMTDTLANQVIMTLPYTESNVLEHYDFVDKLNELKASGDVSFVLSIYSIIPQNAEIEILDGFPTLPAPSAIAALIAILNADTQFGGDFAVYAALGRQLISNGYTVYTVGLDNRFDIESEKSFETLEKIKQYAEDIFTPQNENGVSIVYRSNGERYAALTGVTPAAKDFADITPGDFIKVAVISMAASFAVILLRMKSLKQSLFLTTLTAGGICLNLALQHIFSGGGINFISLMLICTLQLVATSGSSMLAVSKYANFKKRMEPRGAAYLAVSTSVTPIITVALTMTAACLSIYFISSVLLIKEMAFILARAYIISAFSAIFLLPSFLPLFERGSKSAWHITSTRELRPIIRRKKQSS